MKEDALKYALNLEEGWITRQEKLAELSPKSLQKRRFELESWVTLERNGPKSSKKSGSSSASYSKLNGNHSPRAVPVGSIEEERTQVARIIDMVNKKSKEIKNKLTPKTEIAKLLPQQIPQAIT